MAMGEKKSTSRRRNRGDAGTVIAEIKLDGKIVQALESRGIGMAELAWRLKRIYIERGSPFGLGVENFVRWIKPPPSDPSP